MEELTSGGQSTSAGQVGCVTKGGRGGATTHVGQCETDGVRETREAMKTHQYGFWAYWFRS